MEAEKALPKNRHPSIHSYPFSIKILSMSHSMGLADCLILLAWSLQVISILPLLRDHLSFKTTKKRSYYRGSTVLYIHAILDTKGMSCAYINPFRGDREESIDSVAGSMLILRYQNYKHTVAIDTVVKWYINGLVQKAVTPVHIFALTDWYVTVCVFSRGFHSQRICKGYFANCTCIYGHNSHYSDVTWALWQLCYLFNNLFKLTTLETAVLSPSGPLWGESTRVNGIFLSQDSQ